MKRVATALILLLTAAILSGCGSSTTSPGDSFTDKLALGTGASGFTLTGEGTSFTRLAGSVTLYWRLESSADMAGSPVKIRVDKLNGATYAPFDSATYTNPQSYGHIMLSTYGWSSAGTFRASGILTATGHTVATVSFTVS
jgi:hypothetical protein